MGGVCDRPGGRGGRSRSRQSFWKLQGEKRWPASRSTQPFVSFSRLPRLSTSLLGDALLTLPPSPQNTKPWCSCRLPIDPAPSPGPSGRSDHGGSRSCSHSCGLWTRGQFTDSAEKAARAPPTNLPRSMDVPGGRCQWQVIP